MTAQFLSVSLATMYYSVKPKSPLEMSIFNRVLHGKRALRIAQAGFGCNCLKRETRVMAMGTSLNQASKRTRLIAVAIRMC